MVADPLLQDPNFAHSVLLLTEYNEEAGAVAYVLNRPIGKKVSDLLEDVALGDLGDSPVYFGGPVATDHLTFASIGWDMENQKLQVSTHLSLAGAKHSMEEGFEIRAFVGYAGWSEGQLEFELEENTWICKPATKEILSIKPDKNMWSKVLQTMTPYHRLLSKMPKDIHLN